MMKRKLVIDNPFTIDSLPNDILKIILNFNDGLTFLQNFLVCKKWFENGRELMEFQSRKSLCDCYLNSDLIGIIGHMMKFKKEKMPVENIYFEIIQWNYLAKDLNYQNILNYFYKYDQIFAYHIQKEKSLAELFEILDKKEDFISIDKLKILYEQDYSYFSRSEEYFNWRKACIKQEEFLLNEKYILKNIKIICDPFSESSRGWKPLLRILDKNNILESQFPNLMEYIKDGRNPESIIDFICTLNPKYVNNINQFGYLSSSCKMIDLLLSKDYQNELNEIELLEKISFIKIPFYRDFKNIDRLFVIQIKHHREKSFCLWLNVIIPNSNRFLINYGKIPKDSDYIFGLRNWAKYILKYLELCDGVDFIENEFIQRLIDNRFYTIVKYILEKRSKPISKNDKLLLNLLLSNTLTDEKLKELKLFDN